MIWDFTWTAVFYLLVATISLIGIAGIQTFTNVI